SRTPGRGAAVLPFAGDIRLRGKFGDAAFADLELRCELGNRAGADRAVIRSDTCEGIWIVVFGQRQTRAGNIVGNTQAGGAQQLVDRWRVPEDGVDLVLPHPAAELEDRVVATGRQGEDQRRHMVAKRLVALL